MNQRVMWHVPALALLACACADPGAALPAPAVGRPLATDVKVAAVQYGTGSHGLVDTDCASAVLPDACAVAKLVEQAAKAGAKLVVTPEYGLGQKYLEPVPVVGKNPGTDASWSGGSLIKSFSQRAALLKIHLVVNLQTNGGGGARYNSQVAFSPSGAVAAIHHKFELFASERKSLTPGKELNVFSSPVGKVGLLICADLYGDLRKHRQLTGPLGARVVAVSSLWTADGGWRWQQNFARNWGVYVVGSNTTGGAGRGGGIFDPTGRVLAKHTDGKPAVTLANIPAR